MGEEVTGQLLVDIALFIVVVVVVVGLITPPRMNESPLNKGPCQKERIIFQPLFFREHVSFSGEYLSGWFNHQEWDVCFLRYESNFRGAWFSRANLGKSHPGISPFLIGDTCSKLLFVAVYSSPSLGHPPKK